MKMNMIFAVIIAAVMIMSCVSKNETKETKEPVKTETKETPKKETPAEPKIKLVLKAADAKLVTTAQMTIENSSNIGYWGSTGDQAKWSLKVTEDGEYTVTGRYSCSSEFAGAVVKLSVGDQSIDFTVKGTGDWGNYRISEYGKLTLKAGEYPVVIQATSIANRFVMNLMELDFLKY